MSGKRVVLLFAGLLLAIALGVYLLRGPSGAPPEPPTATDVAPVPSPPSPAGPVEPAPVGAPLERIAALPDGEIDLAEAALYVAQRVNPEVDVTRYLALNDAMAGELAQMLEGVSGAEARLKTMASVIYEQWGFGRSDVLPPDVFVGFDEVLDQKQWNCFGLTMLYVTLGARTGTPMRMVAGRGHVFAQADGEPAFFVETTARGELHESKDYLLQLLPFPCLSIDDYVTLNAHETIAVLLAQTGLAQQHQKRTSIARDCFANALRFNPNDAEAHGGLGFLALESGQIDEAIRSFRKAVEVNPRFREGYGGLTTALYARGNLPGAAQANRKAFEACPDDPKSVFNLAQIVYEQGNLDEAIDLYKRYTALAPEDPDGYARLAFPLEDKGDLEGAMAAYEKAIALNPQYADAYVNIGIIKQKQGNLDAARSSFETALQLQPKSALAQAGLARVLHAQGHTEEALKAIAIASVLDPGSSAVWLDYAAILRSAGEVDKAIQLYQNAATLTPTDPEPHEALAEIYLERGETENAKASAQRAKALGAELSPEVAKLLPAAP